MSYSSKTMEPCHPQQAIREKCFHPSGSFTEFTKEEIEQSIPARFEQQVRKYPDRLAIKTRTQELTYDELNQAANRVARAILAQRRKGEEPIALLLENDASMIAAILGVLKAGKIYVPMDPSHPRARTSHILEDSQAGAILTDSRNLSVAEELAQKRLPCINIDDLDASLSSENIGLAIFPDNPTWILYTSGSTGQPKGVVQDHRNVLQYVMSYTNGLHICSDDRFILLFSFSVNGAAHEIFSALLNGASLYPLNIKEVGLASMADWLIQNNVTIYSSVPTVFRHFIDTLTGEEEFPHLRLIKMIGEPVSKREANLYKKHFSEDCIFINRLGSTETGSIRWYFIDKETQIMDNAVPVGYPVEGNEILLLDQAGEKLGFNQIGEIALKSRYLARGYWNKPDRTQAVFLSDPAGGGERIYLTGDLGRMMSDGCLEYIGRKDSQVKMRGYRIETAEIEMALLGLEGIKEAVVVAREDPSGEQRLVAYLIPASNPAPTVTKLRGSLNGRLPDYIIPSLWMLLDALPLAPNGKVDRRALPTPTCDRPDLDTSFAAPRTPVEEILAGIWDEVLGLNQVGIHDNFLDLGGHSLLATQIISRVIDRFRVELPMQSLLESPTVAEMAVVITQNQAKKAEEEDVSHMLAELEALSDEQARQLLADKGGESHGR